MKAIGYRQPLSVTDSESLIDITLPQPIAVGHDLLVKVKAIAVNPVDYKVRQNVAPEHGEYKVLGWDAVGEVVATGDKVTFFQPGDQVFYAGDLNRQGSNAEYQRVDERLVGRKPQSLSNAEAAALPLTSITAYELLFEHLGIKQQNQTSEEVLLVTGAAGGVGSILIQLAKRLTGATVIATASRDSSQAWVRELGADFVIDHTQSLLSQVEKIQQEHGISQITHVASLNATDSYFESFIDLLAPFGRIAMIDDPVSLDVMKLKPKSLSLHIEFMFARSMFNAVDKGEQHRLLNQVSELIDAGKVKTTLGKHLGNINAENLRAAHAELEAGRSIGKIVLENF